LGPFVFKLSERQQLLNQSNEESALHLVAHQHYILG